VRPVCVAVCLCVCARVRLCVCVCVCVCCVAVCCAHTFGVRSASCASGMMIPFQHPSSAHCVPIISHYLNSRKCTHTRTRTHTRTDSMPRLLIVFQSCHLTISTHTHTHTHIQHASSAYCVLNMSPYHINTTHTLFVCLYFSLTHT